MKETLKHLPLEERRNQSQAICRNLLQSEFWRDATGILAFYPFRHEVDLRPLFRQGKSLYLPRVMGNRMEFLAYEGEEKLEPNSWGIMEPRDTAPALGSHSSENLLILIPGLAFHKMGGRIGWGGGYYDRWLPQNRHRGIFLGIAYREQILEDLSQKPWDVPMDGIASPLGIQLCRKE